MDNPELLAAVVSLVLGLGGLITAATAWLKVKTETERIRNERLATKAERDNDSQTLHDQILKNTWEINNLKETQKHSDNLIEDLRQQVGAVNTEVAKALVKLDEIQKSITELKDRE